MGDETPPLSSLRTRETAKGRPGGAVMSRTRAFVYTKAEFRVEPQSMMPAPEMGQAFLFTLGLRVFSEISKTNFYKGAIDYGESQFKRRSPGV